MTILMTEALRRARGGSKITKRIVTVFLAGAVLASSLTVGMASAATKPMPGLWPERMRLEIPWIPGKGKLVLKRPDLFAMRGTRPTQQPGGRVRSARAAH